MHSDGSSEEIAGRLLEEFAKRDDIVLATKVYNRMWPGPNGMSLSKTWEHRTYVLVTERSR